MTTLFLDSIDDLLGDRRDRFFGDGYTRCTQEISALQIDALDNRIDFSGVGRVQLPDDWSKKASVDQTPHLSTIDVIVLSMELHAALSKDPGIAARLLGWAIASLEITAGKTPIEGDLGALTLEGFVDEAVPGEKSVSLHIENMQIRMKLTGATGSRTQFADDSKPPISLADVLLDSVSLTGSAIAVTCEQAPGESWSPTACFAATLQLGQALLYQLDHIHRDETHTLWMKRTSLEFFNEAPTLAAVQPIQVRLHDVRRYTKQDGDWRRADIVGRIANLRIACSVTHRLPDLPNRD